MLVRDSAAVTVKYIFRTKMEQPVMIVSKELARAPGMSLIFSLCTVRGTGNKRFFNKNIQRVDTIVSGMLFKALAEFFSLARRDKMEYTAAEYNIKYSVRPIIENICFKKVNVNFILIGKLLCFFNAGF